MIGKILSFTLLLGVVAGTNNTNTTTKTTTTSTSTTEKPAIYRLYHGIDPNTLSCDPEGHVFLLLPHYTNCGKFFMCVHGEEIEFPCAADLIFDFELQVCNWKWAANCTLRTPKEDIDTEGSGFGSGEETIGIFGEEMENGPIELLTADSAGTVRPKSPTSSRFMTHDLNCNRADSAARRVPYKGDCQKYWRCMAGVPQAVYCSDGLFFNEQSQQCDYEANTKCMALTDDELQGEFMVFKN